MMDKFTHVLFTINFLTIIHGQSDPKCLQEQQQPKTPNIIDQVISPGLAEDVDKFRLSVFCRVGLGTKKSIVMSPYGLWSVLALAYFGTEGDTRSELERALGLGSNRQNIRGEIEYINKILIRNGGDSGTSIQMKDAAYLSPSFQLNPCITQYINNIQHVNFQDAEGTAKLINDEFSRVTQGKITKIVTPDKLFAVQFILVNGIYFNGDWDKQFNRERTRRVRFTSDDSTISEVNMMNLQEEILNYIDDDGLGAHMVEIPYKGKEVFCYFILPASQTSSTDSVLRVLNYQSFESAVQRMKRTPVDFYAPKFKLTSDHSDNLKQALIEEGISSMFHSNANFSSFVLHQNMQVDSVNQKAIIELNEEGTVAAAISSLFGVRSGPSNPINFVCDRPFLFIIRHKQTRTTLFAGVIRHPNDFQDIQ